MIFELPCTSRFQSLSWLSYLTTLASSPGFTSPSRRYMIWLTRLRSRLIPKIRSVGCQVRISSIVIVAVPVVAYLLSLLLLLLRLPPIRYLDTFGQRGNGDRAIKKLIVGCVRCHDNSTTTEQQPRPNFHRTHYQRHTRPNFHQHLRPRG
jgi:hypothetical protein